MVTNPEAKICYYASDMVLNVHSDASYLTAPKAISRAGAHFFLGSIPKDGYPIRRNGAILTKCCILKCVATSAAEAELGPLTQRDGRQDYPPHPQRNGPSTTGHTCTCGKHNRHGNCQQLHQTAMIEGNEHALFLTIVPRSTKDSQCQLPPRTREHWGLSHKSA